MTIHRDLPAGDVGPSRTMTTRCHRLADSRAQPLADVRALSEIRHVLQLAHRLYRIIGGRKIAPIQARTRHLLSGKRTLAQLLEPDAVDLDPEATELRQQLLVAQARKHWPGYVEFGSTALWPSTAWSRLPPTV